MPQICYLEKNHKSIKFDNTFNDCNINFKELFSLWNEKSAQKELVHGPSKKNIRLLSRTVSISAKRC